jgi:hypothetical protein
MLLGHQMSKVISVRNCFQGDVEIDFAYATQLALR